MNELAQSPILAQIRDFLTKQAIAFREVHHIPTFTSVESALARGEDLSTGGKALLVKVDDTFHLFVMSATRKLDSKLIKQHFGAKRTRFATPEELLELTGLVPGSVPPFGKPILPFALFVDASIAANEKIAFNAGSLTDSVILDVPCYLTLANPEAVFTFTSESSAGAA